MANSVYQSGECEECERYVTSLRDGVCKRCRHGEITDMNTPTGRGWTFDEQA